MSLLRDAQPWAVVRMLVEISPFELVLYDVLDSSSLAQVGWLFHVVDELASPVFQTCQVSYGEVSPK